VCHRNVKLIGICPSVRLSVCPFYQPIYQLFLDLKRLNVHHMQRHYSIFLRTKLSREIQTESPSTVLLNTPAGRSICGSRRISKTVRERVVVIVGPLDFREPRVTFKSHFSCRKPILWLVECGGNNMQQMLPIPNYLQPSLLTAR